MKHIFTTAFISISLLLTSPILANDITDEFDKYIKQDIKDIRQPAYSALIFQDDKILYEYISGQSNVETGTALKASDAFLLASVSKLVTGVALLHLFDQGKFKLDDAVSNYLPFNVKNPRHKTPITFRMLLTHTSSIADGSAVDDQYYYGEDSPIKLADFMQEYFSPDGEYYDAGENFHFEQPGTEFHYSNEASALIGLLVEHISGQDFAKYTQQHLFKPLNMTTSHWRLDNAKATIVTPYQDGKPLEHYTFTDYPNGGLHSNAYDLHNLLQMLANQGSFNGQQILQPATVAQMLTPQIPNIDSSVGLHTFKFGRDTGIWGHNGGESGSSTLIGVNPNTKIGIILLTNIDDSDLGFTFEAAYETAQDLIKFSKYD